MDDKDKKIIELESMLKEAIKKNNKLTECISVLLNFINNVNKNFEDASKELIKLND